MYVCIYVYIICVLDNDINRTKVKLFKEYNSFSSFLELIIVSSYFLLSIVRNSNKVKVVNII